MNRPLFYIILSIVFLQCSKKPEKQTNPEKILQQETPKKQTQLESSILSIGDYYFNFDEVTHYKLKNPSVITEVMDKDLNNLSKEDQIIYDCYSEDYPKDLKNKSFLLVFDKMGYKKSILDASKNKDLNEIFREKKHSLPLEPYCIPEYNDILIFRKNRTIVGLAKICFGCMQNHILGTTKNTSEFGQSGDYDKLRELLYK